MSDVEKKDKTVTKKKYVTLDVWKEKFMELRNGGDEFKKIFVLFAISNFLSPYGDKSLNLSAVKSLSNVKNIKDFDWCGFIIKNMCNSIKELHKYLLDKRKRPTTTVSKGQNPTKFVRKIGGCLPAMLVTFVQKVHYGEYAGVKLPFISNWNSDTLNARIKAQNKDRSRFGIGIVKQDIVLSSDVLYENSKAHEATEKVVPLALEYKNELRISSEDESTLYVQYKIPNDLQTDREIQSMDVPGGSQVFSDD
ncbi:uncharacterized protein LOC110688699 isoform X2 [Chenopodium quinoa]|uniref:uncharacterized protein LOC110688699 isoform X2 n=1 Tax=Chenopodium quinoa TaxID=63459 RepID=UPI000B7937F5|nr:uncharacterized protein LOC110688699 isoform X2 [Chenopodium quinoa]